MSNKIFTDEEVYELSTNPNVETVTRKQIRFSRSFKQALKQSLESGVKAEDFLRANGIDPDILGKTRIYGLVNSLENMEDLGFNPPFNNRDNLKILLPDKSSESDKKRIHDLEVKTAYLEQEIEFLKKIFQADLEVRKTQVFKPDPE